MPPASRHKGVLDGRRHGRVAGQLRSAGLDRLSRLDGVEAGFWSQAPTLLQSLRPARRLRRRGEDSLGADFVHLVTEAMKLELRRPRGLLRRPGLLRRAGRDAVVARLCRRAPRADRRRRLARAAAGPDPGLETPGRGGAWPARRGRGVQGRRRRRRADDGASQRPPRRHRAYRRHRPLGQRGRRRRPRAAGCNPRRWCPGSAVP